DGRAGSGFLHEHEYNDPQIIIGADCAGDDSDHGKPDHGASSLHGGGKHVVLGKKACRGWNPHERENAEREWKGSQWMTPADSGEILVAHHFSAFGPHQYERSEG